MTHGWWAPQVCKFTRNNKQDDPELAGMAGKGRTQAIWFHSTSITEGQTLLDTQEGRATSNTFREGVGVQRRYWCADQHQQVTQTMVESV